MEIGVDAHIQIALCAELMGIGSRLSGGMTVIEIVNHHLRLGDHMVIHMVRLGGEGLFDNLHRAGLDLGHLVVDLADVQSDHVLAVFHTVGGGVDLFLVDAAVGVQVACRTLPVQAVRTQILFHSITDSTNGLCGQIGGLALQVGVCLEIGDQNILAALTDKLQQTNLGVGFGFVVGDNSAGAVGIIAGERAIVHNVTADEVHALSLHAANISLGRLQVGHCLADGILHALDVQLVELGNGRKLGQTGLHRSVGMGTAEDDVLLGNAQLASHIVTDDAAQSLGAPADIANAEDQHIAVFILQRNGTRLQLGVNAIGPAVTGIAVAGHGNGISGGDVLQAKAGHKDSAAVFAIVSFTACRGSCAAGSQRQHKAKRHDQGQNSFHR